MHGGGRLFATWWFAANQRNMRISLALFSCNWNFGYVDLSETAPVTRKGDHLLVVRPRRVRMRPLRPVYCVVISFHPAQRLLSLASRCREVFGQSIPRCFPL